MATKTLSSLFRLQHATGICHAARGQGKIVSTVISNRRGQAFLLSSKGFHTSLANRNEHIINIQDAEDFDKRVLKNPTPVVVDFFATWCGPCKVLGPRLESLIAGKNGKVILAKIDVDQVTDVALNHEVDSVPTVIGMKNGKILDKFIGAKDEAFLTSFVDKLIG